jgi:IclR family transcriptional regulator, KDG regulon repressor
MATVVADTATGLRRGLRVLQALDTDEAHAAGGLGVLRIAELLGQDKSLVSRTLRTLDEHGFVDRDPATRAYRLGWALLGVAARAGDAQLVAAAEPAVASLARTLGERVHLSVRRGAEVLTVLTESSSRALEAAALVGTTVPAYCTSAGYALLVDEDLEAVLAGVELAPRGPKTPRSVRQVAVRVEEARRRGYAVADGDFEAGLVAVAAPVRDARGRVVAAVNVSGPTFRLGDRVDEAGAAVDGAATRISALLAGQAH